MGAKSKHKALYYANLVLAVLKALEALGVMPWVWPQSLVAVQNVHLSAYLGRLGSYARDNRFPNRVVTNNISQYMQNICKMVEEYIRLIAIHIKYTVPGFVTVTHRFTKVVDFGDILRAKFVYNVELGYCRVPFSRHDLLALHAS